ncbi:MAG TPA: LysM peptidoglycan-binding domain-containing protein [Opitutaceae bacterium]|nr:LysM peptidoglycan-binding domain-containing protein [Opitutaceae bacterium]
MWRFLVIGWMTTAAALAQVGPSAVDFANLREDVRGLTQRVGDLSLRVEQLERENGDLRQRLAAGNQHYVTLTQLNAAIDDLNRTIQTAVSTSKNETLQQVATQMEKLAKQTNAALDSLAKAQAARPAVQTSFSDSYAKEGTSYTVQKGDTLARIAKKIGAREQDIINANKIQDPSRIVVGQTLFIPNPPTGAAK